MTATGKQSLKPWPLLVLVAAAAVYAHTLGFGFVYDDSDQILANPRIQSWEHLPGLFTDHVWAQTLGPGQANYYRPLFLVWCLLAHSLFGLEPAGWHLMALLTHLLAVYLVFTLGAELLRDTRAAALAAAIFAVHPVQVESAAWVSGVTEPLLAVFSLGALLAYLRSWRETAHPRRWLALAMALFAGALLVKESAVVLPGAILAAVWLTARGQTREGGYRLRAAVDAALLGAVLAGYFLLRHAALDGMLQAQMKVSLVTWLLSLPKLVWIYISHLLFPVGLALNYDVAWVSSPVSAGFVLPALGLALLAAAAPALARRSAVAAYALLWMALFLLLPLLTAALLPYFDIVHDRYLYMPLAGLALLLAAGARRLWTARPVLRPAVAAGAVALVVLLGATNISYARHWKNEEALFRRSVQVAPGALLPRVRLASILLAQRDANAWAEARLHLDAAERHSGGHWLALYGWAGYYKTIADFPAAERYLVQTLAKHDHSPHPYLDLGEVRLRSGRFRESLAPFRQAVELMPGSVHHRLRYATALELSGETAEAARQLRLVLDRLPQEELLRARVERLEAAAARQQQP